jgi:hypothetical protein
MPQCTQCPPQYNQCTPSSRFTETRQCETPKENFVMQCSVDRSRSRMDCYQQQSFQDYEPCYEQSNPCEPCAPRCDPCSPCCDPCEPLGPSKMPCDDSCTPSFNCPPFDADLNPMCSPFRNYKQPPRRESCKPIICYQRPSLPMAAETIYKESFPCIDSQTAASCRLPLVRPHGQLRPLCGEFAKVTIAKVILTIIFLCNQR